MCYAIVLYTYLNLLFRVVSGFINYLNYKYNNRFVTNKVGNIQKQYSL